MIHRMTVYIEDEMRKKIEQIADEKKWSFTVTVSVLLENAIKEKDRKKKNNPRNITANVGSGNSQ